MIDKLDSPNVVSAKEQKIGRGIMLRQFLIPVMLLNTVILSIIAWVLVTSSQSFERIGALAMSQKSVENDALQNNNEVLISSLAKSVEELSKSLSHQLTMREKDQSIIEQMKEQSKRLESLESASKIDGLDVDEPRAHKEEEGSTSKRL